MKKIAECLLGMILTIVFSLVVCSCSDNEETAIDDFDIQFELPSLIEINEGGTYTFILKSKNAPLISDNFVLESEAGVSYICKIINVSGSSFTVAINSQCETGYYNISLKRGIRKKSAGRTYISIIENIGFTPAPDTTIYGLVTAEGAPIAGAVVSDGIEVTTTDAEGIYQLKSAKKWGYVFISIPSGYEVPSQGVLPQFFYYTKADTKITERIDFKLKQVDGQDNYILYVLGDMHLANRTSDLSQFLDFTEDLNACRNLNTGRRQYAIALGDMTWDLYWYDNNYALPEYLATVNNQLRDLQIFHTIGNHDYDYKAKNDLEAGRPYVNNIAPAYYSFNLGQVHYVVMDDIDCDSYDGTISRNYKKRLTNDQLTWLGKDLMQVDQDIPIILVMHAQVFYPSQTDGWKIDHDAVGTNQLLKLLAGRRTHILTGHTHLNFNVTPDDDIAGGNDLYEHNTAAICGSWWWSGHLTPDVHLSPDGTPGGYAIWQVSGQDLQWAYKATGQDENYQFRSYDLNRVNFSLADVPQMSTNASVQKAFAKYADAYPVNSNNEVLINIWNWSPRWTLTVTTETGERLEPKAVWAYDPLHIAALTVKRFNSATLTAVPNFITELFPHFFKVKAPDADIDLTITVQDEFGRTYTERMYRPKEFVK